MWTGGRGGIDVALLVAVATGGYHVSTYQWAGERGPLEEEIYPLLYVTDRGVFKCTITTNPGIKVELEFTVSCKYVIIVPFSKHTTVKILYYWNCFCKFCIALIFIEFAFYLLSF